MMTPSQQLFAMKKIISLLVLLHISKVCRSQRAGVWFEAEATIIKPTEISLSESEIVNPLRGFYDWQSVGVRVPNLRYPEYYKRYMWDEVESNRDVYDFSVIEQDLLIAKKARQKFAFRIMSVNSFHSDEVGVPNYMLSEVPGDYCSYYEDYIKNDCELDRVWVPDWNSTAFLNRARALVNALGKQFDGRSEIAYYDMGIYGHWGEWHAYPFTKCRTAGEASDATKRAIVDMQLMAFSESRIVMNSGAENSEAFQYTLSKSPKIGIRIDSFNWPWFDDQINNDPIKKDLVESRWKTAPIIVEFGGIFRDDDSEDFSLANSQVTKWHLASLANGNSYTGDVLTPNQRKNFQLAGKRSGYRFVLRECSWPGTLNRGRAFRIRSKWSNVGVTPLYETFSVRYELRRKGANMVVWRCTSSFDLETFLPTVSPGVDDVPVPVNDRCVIGRDITQGMYTLSLVVADPTGYRDPLALAIKGRDSSGRYVLGDLRLR